MSDLLHRFQIHSFLESVYLNHYRLKARVLAFSLQ